MEIRSGSAGFFRAARVFAAPCRDGFAARCRPRALAALPNRHADFGGARTVNLRQVEILGAADSSESSASLPVIQDTGQDLRAAFGSTNLLAGPS